MCKPDFDKNLIDFGKAVVSNLIIKYQQTKLEVDGLNIVQMIFLECLADPEIKKDKQSIRN
jgi:hypothetical protein